MKLKDLLHLEAYNIVKQNPKWGLEDNGAYSNHFKQNPKKNNTRHAHNGFGGLLKY